MRAFFCGAGSGGGDQEAHLISRDVSDVTVTRAEATAVADVGSSPLLLQGAGSVGTAYQKTTNAE